MGDGKLNPRRSDAARMGSRPTILRRSATRAAFPAVDCLNVPLEEIGAIEAVMTMVGGKVVYEAKP